MTMLSAPRAVTYEGQPAELRVLRNNGYCWGVVYAPGTWDQLCHVDLEQDMYEDQDDEALDAMEGALAEGVGLDPTCAGEREA